MNIQLPDWEGREFEGAIHNTGLGGGAVKPRNAGIRLLFYHSVPIQHCRSFLALAVSYLRNSRMYTPRYLKYLQFSEAFFSMGSPCLKIFYRQKCYAICRIDHHALRGITWYSNPHNTGLMYSLGSLVGRGAIHNTHKTNWRKFYE